MKTYLRLYINCKSLSTKVTCSIRLFLLLTISLFANLGLYAQIISNVTVSGTPVCAGSTVTINFDVQNGSGVGNYYNNATSYQVYLSNAVGGAYTLLGASFTIFSAAYTTTDNSIINGLSTLVTIPPATTTGASYKISIGSSNPTYVASAGQNASAGFSVNGQVTPTVSIAANPGTTICAGTNVTFTASPTNGGINPSYQWQLNGVNLAGETAATLTRNTLLNSDQIRVLMTTSSEICANPGTVTSNILTMTVNPTVLPSVIISANPSSPFCIGTSVTFTAAVPNNGGLNPTYQWQINSIDIAGANGTTFTRTTLVNGDVVRVELTSNAACASPNPVYSNEITVSVLPNATISLSSANNNQSVCINNAITNILYNIGGGGTVATVSGLPAGVTGSYSSGVFTISGTPTVSGIFNYTATTTGTCAQTSASGTITVNPNATISLTSANNNQSVCINNAIANITFNVGASGNNASVSGLPPGVSGSYSAGVFTIIGTVTTSGTFAYTVTATGTCGNATTGGTITVNPAASVALTSAIGTNNQIRCISTAITNITYSIGGGGTGATVSGLPTGVSGNYSGGVYTISGTPSVSGIFNYTVTTTGTCGQTSASGTITVNPNATISLTSANNNQSVCINNAIADITFNVGATGNNASVSGLPPGVSGSYSAGVFTISGTATTSGTFAYTVTATGTCGNATTGGTLTINPAASIALTSAIGTNNQTRCISTAITNITYSIGGGGTGATVSGLPTGVSGNYSSGEYTISGTPSVSGIFNYTVTTTGTCAQTSASGTITVNPNATISLTSANNNQSVCINNAIADITFNVGATGNNASVSGLPPGVSGSYSAGVFTISGTATTSGTFAYTVTATGTCGNATTGGTLTINPAASVALTSAIGTNNQIRCISTAITNITYSIGGGGTGATVSGLPTGVSGNYSGGVYTISGTPSVSGIFNYTVTTTGTCGQTSASGTITVNPNATISLTSANNNQSVCINNAIADITFNLGATGNNASVSGLPSGVLGSYSAGIFTISGTATNSGTFAYTVTATGTCGNATTGGTLTINANSTLTLTSSVATTNQNACRNPGAAIATITYLVAAGGTGVTVTGLPAGVTSNYNSGTKVVTISGTPTAAAGIYNFTVTSTGSCVNVSLSGTITVYDGAPSQPDVIVGSTAICPVVSVTYSVTAVPNATSYNWTFPNAGWVVTSGANTNSVSVNVGSTAIGGNISVSAVNICGQSNPRLLPISVGNFAFANAGPDQTVCALSPTVTLAGTIGGVINNQNEWDWSASPVGGSFGSPNSLTSTFTPNAAQIAAGSVTISIITVDPAGTCPAVSDQMIITIRPTPTASISGVATICAGTSTNINFTATANTTVSYTINGGAIQTIPISGTGLATLNSGVLVSNTTFSLSSVAYTSTPSCSAVVSGSTLINVNSAVITNSGADQTVCASSPNVTLAGTITGGASTGTWSDGTGTFNPNNTTLNAIYTPSAAEIAAGIVTLTLTSADPAGPCGATSDAMVITINPSVVTNANVDQTVCASSPNVTLAGIITGGATTGTWSGGTGTFNPNNTTLNAIYTPSAAEIATGTVTLTLTSADPAGPCGATSDAMVITINPSVVTNANVDQTICASSPNVTLAGTITGGASKGTWSGGTGTFNPNNTTLNAIYTPSAAEITAGTVTLTLTSEDPTGPCGATSDAMVISINPSVVTNANVDQTVCVSSPNVTLAGTITGGATTGTWSGGTGTFNPNNTTLNAIYTPSAEEITAGTVTLTLTSADPSVPCAATSDALVIAINPTVITNAGADQTVCASSPNITLAGTITGGASTGTWSGGTGTFNPNNTALNAIYTPSAAEIAAGTVTLTLTSADPAGPCVATSDAMVITINIPATVSAGSNQTICSNTNATMAGSFGGSTTSATWTTNGTGSFNNNTTTAIYTPSPADIIAGAVTLTYTTNDPVGPCGSVSSSIILTINTSININTQPSNVGVCASSPAIFGAVASGGIVSYQWYKGTFPGTAVTNTATITGATTNILNFSQVSIADGGLYYLQINGAAPCPSLRSTEVSLNVSQSIVISSQPAPQIICQNSPVTFSVVASAGGTALTYQWRKGGSNIAGATSANYTIASVATADAGSYDVVITGPSGFTCPTVTSAAAILSVNTLPVITGQPSSTNQVWCLGQTANTLSVVANGTGLTYQWYSNTLNSNSGGTLLVGATSMNYTPITTSAGTLYYYVVVSGTCTPAVTSAVSGSVLVNTAPAITVQPSTTGETICQNSPATQLSVTATGAGLSYQWYRNTTNSNTGGTAVGTNTNTYTPATTTAGTFYYYVIVSGTCPSPATSAVSGAIVVNAPPAITGQPSSTNQVWCLGQSATTLSVVANGTGLTYQWYSNTLNSNSGGTLLVGATSMNYTPITTSAGTLYYYVVVSGTCTPAVTSAVSGSVLVNTAPAITVQPSTTGETICQNSPATQLSVTATGAGLSYQWYSNTTNSNTGGTAVGTNTNTYTPANTTAGTFYYYVIVSGTCPPPATSAISGAIIVNAPPAITGQPSTTNQTACQNIPATTLNVVANGAGLMYQWYSNAVNSNTGGTAISGANNANYTPSTTTIGLLYYYVVVSGTCAPPIASAVSVSVTVLAPPAISIQPSITPASYCLNATATSLSVTASGFTITYQWYRNSTNSNSGGTAIGGATSATYIPPTNSTGVSYYYVVVTGGCAPPITSNVSGAIQIDPLSVGGTLSIQNATTPPNVVTLCPNVGTSIINLAGNTGTVTWEKSIDGGASWIPATGTATQTSLTVSNLAQTTIYRAVVKSGACSITYSTNAVVSVIPPFTPNPVIATPSAICIGDTAVLSAGTGFNQWGTAVDGTFNNANPLGWQVKINGVLQGNFPANGNNTSISEWSESNPKTFNGVAYDNSNVPGTGKFAVCLGTINTTMESPVFTLVGMPTAVLTFWQAGTFLSGTTGAVEISIDGGASYLPLAQYSNANPPPGNPNGGWASTTLNLNNYLGQNNVRIRWNYSGTAGSVWAVDAITLPSAPPIVTYVWTPTTAVIGSSTTSPISVSPAVTTTYTINSTVGGCANASSVPVTVTVNPRADITPSGISPTVCASTVAQTASISYSNAINGANTYSIRWRATPVNSFALVNNATLSGGIINITVPANTSPGSYAGYLTVSNSSTGCSATGDSIYIIVNARPTATLNGTTAICLGGSATITIPVTGPGTITGQLSGGINFSGTAPSITVTVSPAVTTIYTITSLTNGTCASLATDYSGTYTVNIVTPATISAQPISTDACLGSSVVLSSAANNIAVGGGYQWQVRTTPSGTWADISNGAQYSGVITANLTVNSVSIAMIDYDYRVKVNSGTPCNLLLNSDSAKIMIKNVWTGGTSIDWMTGSNWSNGAPPTLACDDTYILGNRSFQPTLTSGTGTVKNLIVAAGAYLTVNGTGILGVAGLITNAGTVDLLAGTLLLNGTTSQIIEGPVFKEKTIFRLTLNNNVNVIGNDTLKISHAIGFAPEANGKTFNASTKNVSLLSTLNYTANVNEIKNGNSILGNNFTVERYISTGTVHGQTWQLLSTAITGQSIFNSWQESGIYKPGLGTRITSPLYNGSNGFDATSLRDAIKVYNPNIDEFDGVTSTLNNLANPKGYYIFIRGDRNVFSAANAANPTTLRSTGTLNIGNSLPVVAVQAGKYESIGNPYPSTFDLRKFYTDHSALLTFDVYVWDATLGGLYGVGGYRTLTYLAGDYYAVPAGGFYSSISNLIQSGQAFFIRSKGPAGAINFKESYKEDTSMLASRTQSHANIPTIQTTLKGANAGAPQILLDGALAVFGDDYSNDVNFDDANKFINVGINTGFVRSGKILAVERRQLPTAADTMHLNFSGAKQLSYTWSINIQNLEDAGVDVWLWDKFLNSRTSLVINGNTNINFGVDNTAASIAPDRFKIIFKKVILPVRLIGITAIRKNDNTVSVNWKVENEINVTNYTLERSADGIIFNSLSVKEPLYNNGAQADYSYQDASPLFTDCYYRIKAVSQSGLIQYSAKVKVEALNLPPSISVYPIPVINKEMNLLFVNKAKGRYNIQITNNLGQIVYNGEVVVATVMENKKISLVNLKTEGIYQLAIKAQDGSTNKLQQILVK